MLPAILGTLGAGGLSLVIYDYFFKKPDLKNLPPTIVDQGVADPTTGKPIVTLHDESEAFKHVEAASPFPDASKALYTHIKANGYDDSVEFSALVEAFQKAANKVLVGSFYKYGKLPENGIFDIATAGTLAQSTQDPLPADPSAPRPPTITFAQISTNGVLDSAKYDVNDSSLVQNAIWSLKKYIQLHGDTMRDPQQMVLTRQLQVAYNTDPAYPGPGWAMSATKNGIPQTKLAEDGLLGAASKAILYKDQSQSDFNTNGAFLNA